MKEPEFRYQDTRLKVEILKNNYLTGIRRAFDIKRTFRDRLNNFEEALTAELSLRELGVIVDYQKHGEIFR